MLAHELRNPLAPLSNAAEILANPDIDATSKMLEKSCSGSSNI